MHELGVTENILHIALRYAEEAQASHITDVYLVVGDMSSIVNDSVQFYWDFVSEGTIAQKAQLHFRRVAAEMLCLVCQTTYALNNDLACPACGGTQVKVIAGEEFYLEAIDVEEEAGLRHATSVAAQPSMQE